MQAFHIRYRNTQGTLMRIMNAASRRGLDLISVQAEPAEQDYQRMVCDCGRDECSFQRGIARAGRRCIAGRRRVGDASSASFGQSGYRVVTGSVSLVFWIAGPA